MADGGSVSFTYEVGGKTEVGQIAVSASGIDVDDVLDLFVQGLAASTDPVYTVTRAQVTETVTRDKRGPSVRTGRVGGQTVPVPDVAVAQRPGRAASGPLGAAAVQP